MSHLPWQLQEMMGVAERPSRSKRVAHPTSKTPATFDCSWGYSENGPTDPQPEPGVTTYMGPALTQHAGKGQEWPDNHASALRAALEILRKQGFACELPPEGYDLSNSLEEHVVDRMSAQEKEIAYLTEEYCEDMEINRGGETQIIMTINCDWICLRCANQDVASIVDDCLAQSPHFALGRVEHKQETIATEDDVLIVQTTGNGERRGGIDCSPCSPGTLFELIKGDKVISKALCSYHNAEMDNSGPTIELFETAAEWQRHGYATRLLDAMEEHFQTIFADLEDVARVKYNVCYVTNEQACQWFLSQGFQDWDGMGEELGKSLFD